METYIIAEIGVNHNGDYDIARQLIYEAKRSGANAVKFQKWGNDYYNKCEWRNNLDGLDLTNEDFYLLKDYTKKLNIDFFITAFDMESWLFVRNMDLDIYKIPSNQYVIENKEMVDDIVEFSWHENKKLFISTSRYTYEDVIIFYSRNPNAVFFHCVSKYPTPTNKSNLKRINEMKKYCEYIGLSDHSATIEIPVAAVALGARVIEVHITLDKNQTGPDHKSSLDVKQFSDMVRMIRNVEKAI